MRQLSEKAAGLELGIPLDALKRIKRLASDPRFDILHPPQQLTASIDQSQFHGALTDGRLVFERLLEYEYARATGRQPSYRQNEA